MLLHPTIDKLRALKLTGMTAALEEMHNTGLADALSFEEKLGLLVDRERTERDNKAIASRLKSARLRQSVAYEQIDFRHPRGLDRAIVTALLSGDWVRRHNNCLITGPTGVGKSFLACALANKACRDGWRVFYARTHRLLGELALAKADGTHARRLAGLARCDLLVLDDFGLAPFTHEHARDLLEILDDRYDRRSTLVASQLPVEAWHQAIAEPTLADAALDRLVHNAHRLALHGDSLRKTQAREKTQPNEEQQTPEEPNLTNERRNNP
jgi:DNA replication protein DnaC